MASDDLHTVAARFETVVPGTELAAVLDACEHLPQPVLIFELPSAHPIGGNAQARSIVRQHPRSFDEVTVGSVQRDLQIRRWLQFCADRRPYTIVQTLRVAGEDRLVLCSVWPVDGDHDLAVIMFEDLRAGPWASTTSSWLDRWEQPAIALDDRAKVLHVNRPLRAVLGWSRDLEVAAESLAVLEAAVQPVLAAAEDGHATHVIVPDRFGVPTELVLGRFPAFSVVDPRSTIVTGYAVRPALRLIPGLSFREAQIARHLGAGSRVVHVAESLGISEHTVRNHLRSVFAKLGISSQTELIELQHGEHAP